jgi:hypothetical protein
MKVYVIEKGYYSDRHIIGVVDRVCPNQTYEIYCRTSMGR